MNRRICLLVMVCCFLPAISATPAETPSPAYHLTEGERTFQQGAFAEAVSHWRAAARLYEQAGQPKAQSAALTHLAQAYQALGQGRQALRSLTTALALAKQADDRPQVAMILGSLGNASLAAGMLEDAARYLHEGLQLARDLGHMPLVAHLLNNQGNLLSTQGQYQEALRTYRESLQLAMQATDRALAARAATNAARAALSLEQYTQAKEWLDTAWKQLQHVQPSHDTIYGLVSLGQAYDALRPSLPDAREQLLLGAAAAFKAAAEMAETHSDTRAASYAWGYLGRLYETEARYDEALNLTRRAVFAASQVYAPESLYRWQWQTGRLLYVLGHLDAAIAAYRRAVATLQSFRQEMGPIYGQPSGTFRETLGPVYFGLVDLLLQRSTLLQEPSQVEAALLEARDTLESFKAFELEDYFQDECVIRARTMRLEVVSQTAVVIYPIILPDRLELLVSLPAGLKRVVVLVGSEELTREVRAFRYHLQKRTTRRYLPYARELYNWLIRPLETDLATTPINTLVFVPDGPLRTIPMAALHDGEVFLIQKYAVATTPGLQLTDPRPLPRGRTRILAAGLSQAVQGFTPLPNVTQEIETLQTLYDTETLVNETFLLSNVQAELQENPFTIVHIASHGQFRENADDTFLLTFDEKLTLDQLDAMIGLLRFRDEPLELLTLSACQTAAGDDRAALGLAGIAVKAGARSALATLWFINDQASAALVGAFYQYLQDPSLSRATALQQAQLTLIQDQRYGHPAYWAPFLLINNWL
jgi:CHAT domain-containing protein